jgi:hypothetical protein
MNAGNVAQFLFNHLKRAYAYTEMLENGELNLETIKSLKQNHNFLSKEESLEIIKDQLNENFNVIVK